MMRIFGFRSIAPTPSEYSWGADYTRALANILNAELDRRFKEGDIAG